MTEIKDVKLSEIIPENLVKDSNVKASAEALDPSLQEVSRNVDIPSIYIRIKSLTSEQLDHMAAAWDASVWRQSWPIQIKRRILNNVILEKRKRGTLGAVKKAIETIASFTSLTEWWQETPKGTPHTFKVIASLNNYEGVLESDLQEDLFGLIDDAKPVRSHYDFILQKRYSGEIGAIGIYRKLAYARVKGVTVNSEEASVGLGVIPAVRPVIIRNIQGTAE